MKKVSLERPERPSGRLPKLTKREQQVLAGVALGLTNRAIGRDLGVSEHTVKTYVASLLKKSKTPARGPLVSWGFRNGLLQDVRREEREIEPFTEAEAEMVAWVVWGLTNREIGNKVNLAEDTVKTHLHRAFKKVGAKTRAHLITISWHHKLVPDELWEA